MVQHSRAVHAVHAAFEHQFGEVVLSVGQQIRAVAVANARALGVTAASPGPWVGRKCRKHRGE